MHKMKNEQYFTYTTFPEEFDGRRFAFISLDNLMSVPNDIYGRVIEDNTREYPKQLYLIKDSLKTPTIFHRRGGNA